MIKNKRILWIDISKGIGIILVLIGHVSQNQYINSFIYSFHMPLFFIISGYLYNDKPKYIRKKIKSILIPYLFLAIISFIYWYFIERYLREQDIKPLNAFFNIWLAKGGDTNYVFNVALWFLPCLFVTELIFHFLIKRIKNTRVLFLIIFLFSIIGYGYARFEFIRLPFGIDIAFIAIGFYFLGYLWRYNGEKFFKQSNLNTIKKIIISCLCFIIVTIISLLGNSMDMNNLKYPIYPLIYLTPIIATFMIYLISNMLNKDRILSYIGANTLIIMGIHEPIKRIVIEIIHRVTNISNDILRTQIFGILSITIILILTCVPCIYVINNYLPFLIGRKKEKKNASY